VRSFPSFLFPLYFYYVLYTVYRLFVFFSNPSTILRSTIKYTCLSPFLFPSFLSPHPFLTFCYPFTPLLCYRYLLILADHIHSCRFGAFLFDSDLERVSPTPSHRHFPGAFPLSPPSSSSALMFCCSLGSRSDLLITFCFGS
jgi:Myotubularin-like phosphatase domain